MDTNPLTMDPSQFIQNHQSAFNDGADALHLLTEGKVHIAAGVGHRFIINDYNNREVTNFRGLI